MEKKSKLHITDVLDYAEDNLRNRITYEVEVNNYSYDDDDGEIIDDMIHEVADEEIPIYHTQLLEVCMSDISMATETPEMECDNAIACIQANIFQEIYDTLYAMKYTMYEEIEEQHNKEKK